MTTANVSDNGRSFEIYCGLTIAFFAAILAINDLFAGKYGDDEIIAINEKANAFMWYQSKGIKETVLEGQRDLLKGLLHSGTIAQPNKKSVETFVRQLDRDLVKYAKEKREILKGSSQLGRENWAQEINGELGKIVGALEHQSEATRLGAIGERLDFASLFLQLCLVMGAVSLVLQTRATQKVFYALMVSLGLVGCGFTFYGLF